MSPTLLDLADLFGGPRSASARVMAMAFQAARASTRPALLRLEGVNRSPTEAWLTTLLASRELIPGAVLRLGPPRLGPDIIEQLEPPLSWPSGLALGGTLVHGATTLPLSHDLFANAVVIPVRARDSVEVTAKPPPTEVQAGSWKPQPLAQATQWTPRPELDGLEATAKRFEAGLASFEPREAVRRQWLV